MKNETIVDRVVDRIKKQPLGDLIQEEDLYDIIKEAIPKAFFEERIVQEGSGYSSKTVRLEPVIVQALRESLELHVKDWVKNWTVENAEVVKDYWNKVMDEKLLAYVQRIQNEQATAHIRIALEGYVNNMNQERNRMGLPSVYF